MRSSFSRPPPSRQITCNCIGIPIPSTDIRIVLIFRNQLCMDTNSCFAKSNFNYIMGPKFALSKGYRRTTKKYLSATSFICDKAVPLQFIYYAIPGHKVPHPPPPPSCMAWGNDALLKSLLWFNVTLGKLNVEICGIIMIKCCWPGGVVLVYLAHRSPMSDWKVIVSNLSSFRANKT